MEQLFATPSVKAENGVYELENAIFISVSTYIKIDNRVAKKPLQSLKRQYMIPDLYKFLNKIDINDLYEYMTYLKDACKESATTRARKVASIRGFFKYLHTKARVIDDNPAKELESPKLGKKLPKFLTLEQQLNNKFSLVSKITREWILVKFSNKPSVSKSKTRAIYLPLLHTSVPTTGITNL